MRILSWCLPVAVSILLARLAAAVVPKPEPFWAALAWLAGVTCVSLVSFGLAHRLAKRLLPLSVMFNMSLVFPDKAPDRFRMALRSGTARDLERRLARLQDPDDVPEPAEAATLLVGLLADLTSHDRRTRGHSERVRAYTDVIADQLRLKPGDLDKLHWSALIHDLGKVTVPSEILNKPGRPTGEEWQVLRGHPAAAAALLEPLRPWLGDWTLAASQHHERYDGGGYPNGLTGKETHLSGRIVAVADAYDVMTSSRSYKKPLSAEAARKELVANAGTQFDPVVVRAFVSAGLDARRRAGGWLGGVSELPQLLGGIGARAAAGAAVATAAVAPLAVGDVAPATAEPPSIGQPPASVVEPAPDPTTSSARQVSDGGSDPTPTTGPVTSTTTVSTTTTVEDSGPVLQPTTTTTSPSGPTDPVGPPTESQPTTTQRRGPTPTTLPTTTTTASTTTVPTTTAPPPPFSAYDDSAVVLISGQVEIPVLGNDGPNPAVDPATLTIVDAPDDGRATVVGRSGFIRYSESSGLIGSDSFRYRVCTIHSQCDAATVRISILLSL